MQRSFFLFLLCVVSVTFLWLQITVFNNIEPDRKYITQVKGVFGLLPDFVLRGWDDERRVAKDDLLLLVYDFNETCSRNGLTTFLIDPVILQSFLQEHVTNAAGEKAPSRCYNFCQKSSITFGVLANSWNIHVLNDLKDKGIRFIFTSGTDSRLANLTAAAAPALIPVHLFFVRNQFVIHVIVLYERGVLGLWHGAFSPDHLSSNDTFTIEERERLVALHRNFQNEGVLNRFSLRFSIVDGLSVRLPSEITVFLKDLEESRFLPCNIETAREFYSKYGDDKSEEAWSFRKRGKDVLQIAKIVLDNLEVPFWLSSGTCLGWFRQCSVISHGKDMDIGIWIKHYKKDLIEEFLTNGLYLDHIFGKVEDSFQMSFRTIDDIKLDIFFFYEEGTYMWNGGTQAKSGKKFKYIFPNFSLCWTEFLGMKVRVPCETQAYIEANYGTSWAVPIKQWDWKKSPSNVIENGKWDKKDWPEVIQFFEIQ